MAFGKKKKDDAEKASKKTKEVMSYNDYPHLVAVKPREKYVFHSDYFQVDGSFATIMSFFHMDGANDNFPAFWGIARIPNGLDQDITVLSFEQVRRMTKNWVDQHEHVAESIAQKNADEQERAGTAQNKIKSSRKQKDYEEIAAELGDNAAYLQCVFKVMLKAPTLEKLDEAVEKLGRRYLDAFSTLDAAAYAGRQRQELTTLFSNNSAKVGRKYYFTSTEFAGDYNLVTHGMEDPNGEYVGRMYGDVNTAAVIFETNGYKHHVVIGNEFLNDKLGRTPMADYWGSKLSQTCMIHNGRVVHLILDGCNLDLLGPKFSNLTYRIDMNKGDLNMFEMFGNPKDELSIFPRQMQKLILMAEQAYESTESDRSIIRGSLEEIATKFYVDNKMWYDNAQTKANRLRIVGIPHAQVPKLEMFTAYLDTEHKKAIAAGGLDSERVHALNILKTTFKAMLSNNGDLFNTTTTSVIDGADKGRRVIYDFSGLAARGKGVAMAQLVNIVGFAIENLGKNDIVIFHGTEAIADRVKPYIRDLLDGLYRKGGRAVFLYNNITRMFEDTEFSAFDKADYTVLGTMSPNQLTLYQEKLGRDVSPDLGSIMTRSNEKIVFLRRGFTNVVFEQDLLLGMTKGHKEARI